MITENKILMEFVVEYVKEKDLKNNSIDQINYMRLFKKIILLAEIIGARGLATIEYYKIIGEKSILEQNIEFPPTEKLKIKAIWIWNKFKEQLKIKELYIVYDFKIKAESRLKVLKCRQYYKYKEKDREIRVFQKEGINQNEIEEDSVIEVEWICCIGKRFKYNNQITVISAFEIEATLPTLYLTPSFNEQIKVALQEGRAVAGCDASVKNDIIGAY